MTYSNSYNESFTITHAKYLASKVSADLKRIQRFYGEPSDDRIREFESEITLFLKEGYLKKVTYGFQRNGEWIEPSLIYTSQDLKELYSNDDDPGRVRAGADIDGASFTSFLSYSDLWFELNKDEKAKFKETLPIQRISGNEPGIDGYIEKDNTYSSGGKTLNRSNVRNIKK